MTFLYQWIRNFFAHLMVCVVRIKKLYFHNYSIKYNYCNFWEPFVSVYKYCILVTIVVFSHAAMFFGRLVETTTVYSGDYHSCTPNSPISQWPVRVQVLQLTVRWLYLPLKTDCSKDFADTTMVTATINESVEQRTCKFDLLLEYNYGKSAIRQAKSLVRPSCQ